MPFACLDPRIIVQERSELFFSSLSPTATCPSLINTDLLSLAAHYNDANQSDFPRLLKDIMLFLNTFKNVLDNVRHPRVAAQAPSRLSYHRLRAEETAPKRSSILTRATKSVTNPLHWKLRPNKATFVNTRDGTTTPIATTSGHSKLLKIDSAIILTNCWNLNMNIQGYSCQSNRVQTTTTTLLLKPFKRFLKSTLLQNPHLWVVPPQQANSRLRSTGTSLLLTLELPLSTQTIVQSTQRHLLLVQALLRPAQRLFPSI
jgi:hypothetical protein